MLECLDDIPVSAPLTNVHDSSDASLEGLPDEGKPFRKQRVTCENLDCLACKTIQILWLEPTHVTNQQELPGGIWVELLALKAEFPMLEAS